MKKSMLKQVITTLYVNKTVEDNMSKYFLEI